MRTRFTYRSDDFELPNPDDLFELTRLIFAAFTLNPLRTFNELESHIVPMGQLQNGIFISFKARPESVIEKLSKMTEPDESLRLEMSWPIQGMVRVEVTNKSKATQLTSHVNIIL